MKQQIFKITSNVCIAKNTYEMVLTGDGSNVTNPGQFINIKLDGFFLRRPISICDYSENSLTIIYKVVGKGTEKMALMQSGDELDVLTPLGNGYDTSLSGDRPLLVGGGAGVPPLYALAKKLVAEGKKPCAILGFNSADEVFYADKFEKAGAEVIVTTIDGSMGVKGVVTAAMDRDYTYFYTCGPEVMLRAVYEKSTTSGQMSFEERMGCGFGACMGCSCETLTGNKRICKEGPVMKKEEIIWKD